MSLSKVTYASTLTEFINVPSLSLASIHSICVVSGFLHFLSQMSLTSYDQILKGLLNQKCVAKLYTEKIIAVCMKILIWRVLEWKGHGGSAGGSVDPPHTSACHQHTSASHGTNNLLLFIYNWPLSGSKMAGETWSIFFPSNSTTENKLSLKYPLYMLTLNVFCNS